jgi:hypothetical protein
VNPAHTSSKAASSKRLIVFSLPFIVLAPSPVRAG